MVDTKKLIQVLTVRLASLKTGTYTTPSLPWSQWTCSGLAREWIQARDFPLLVVNTMSTCGESDQLRSINSKVCPVQQVSPLSIRARPIAVPAVIS